MENTNILELLSKRNSFSTRDFYEVFHQNGSKLGNEALRKKLQSFVKSNSIVRVGRGLYSVANNTSIYKYDYSNTSLDIANIIMREYPNVSFSIFELRQLNEFVNHQLAHNIIFLTVDNDALNFVFETLNNYYLGKVLLKPSLKSFHQYYHEDMIVLNRLITEAPKGIDDSWHTPLEKMLVDLFADNLIYNSISFSEYTRIFSDAFHKYAIDESCMFRYAKRRNAYHKIYNFISNQPNNLLRTKE